jgi:hypothetical protein
MTNRLNAGVIVEPSDKMLFAANVLEFADLTLQSAGNKPLTANQLGGLCSVLHYLQRDTSNIEIVAIDFDDDDERMFTKNTQTEPTVETDWSAIEAKIKDGRWTIENLRYYESPDKSNRPTMPAELLLKEANNRLTYALDYLSGPLTHCSALARVFAKKVITPEDIKYILVVLQSVREGLRACCNI